MGLREFLLLCFCFSLVTCFRQVCYFTNWSASRPGQGHFTPADINPNLCTHIIFAYARIVGERIVPTGVNDENSLNFVGFYERVASLKTINPDLKVLLGVNGWNTRFHPQHSLGVLASPNFAQNTIDFLRQRGFDGIDVDWEYTSRPRGQPTSKDAFTELLRALHDSFEAEAIRTGRPKLLLSAAVTARKADINKRYDIPSMMRYVDFVNVMSYDFHGPWKATLGHSSPLHPRGEQLGESAYLNTDAAINYWIQQGANKKQIVVGIPFYGRTYTVMRPNATEIGDADVGIGPAGPFTLENGFMAFYEICELLRSGATRVWHPEHKAPYLITGSTWVSFDDPQSVREKAQWIRNQDLGGAMVWSLDLDDFSGRFCKGGRYPLLNEINSVFKGSHLIKTSESGLDSSLTHGSWKSLNTGEENRQPPDSTFQTDLGISIIAARTGTQADGSSISSQIETIGATLRGDANVEGRDVLVQRGLVDDTFQTGTSIKEAKTMRTGTGGEIIRTSTLPQGPGFGFNYGIADEMFQNETHTEGTVVRSNQNDARMEGASESREIFQGGTRIQRADGVLQGGFLVEGQGIAGQIESVKAVGDGILPTGSKGKQVGGTFQTGSGIERTIVQMPTEMVDEKFHSVANIQGTGVETAVGGTHQRDASIETTGSVAQTGSGGGKLRALIQRNILIRGRTDSGMQTGSQGVMQESGSLPVESGLGPQTEQAEGMFSIGAGGESQYTFRNNVPSGTEQITHFSGLGANAGASDTGIQSKTGMNTIGATSDVTGVGKKFPTESFETGLGVSERMGKKHFSTGTGSFEAGTGIAQSVRGVQSVTGTGQVEGEIDFTGAGKRFQTGTDNEAFGIDTGVAKTGTEVQSGLSVKTFEGKIDVTGAVKGLPTRMDVGSLATSTGATELGQGPNFDTMEVIMGARTGPQTGPDTKALETVTGGKGAGTRFQAGLDNRKLAVGIAVKGVETETERGINEMSRGASTDLQKSEKGSQPKTDIRISEAELGITEAGTEIQTRKGSFTLDGGTALPGATDGLQTGGGAFASGIDVNKAKAGLDVNAFEGGIDVASAGNVYTADLGVVPFETGTENTKLRNKFETGILQTHSNIRTLEGGIEVTGAGKGFPTELDIKPIKAHESGIGGKGVGKGVQTRTHTRTLKFGKPISGSGELLTGPESNTFEGGIADLGHGKGLTTGIEVIRAGQRLRTGPDIRTLDAEIGATSAGERFQARKDARTLQAGITLTEAEKSSQTGMGIGTYETGIDIEGTTRFQPGAGMRMFETGIDITGAGNVLQTEPDLKTLEAGLDITGNRLQTGPGVKSFEAGIDVVKAETGQTSGLDTGIFEAGFDVGAAGKDTQSRADFSTLQAGSDLRGVRKDFQEESGVGALVAGLDLVNAGKDKSSKVEQGPFDIHVVKAGKSFPAGSSSRTLEVGIDVTGSEKGLKSETGVGALETGINFVQVGTGLQGEKDVRNLGFSGIDKRFQSETSLGSFRTGVDVTGTEKDTGTPGSGMDAIKLETVLKPVINTKTFTTTTGFRAAGPRKEFQSGEGFGSFNAGINDVKAGTGLKSEMDINMLNTGINPLAAGARTQTGTGAEEFATNIGVKPSSFSPEMKTISGALETVIHATGADSIPLTEIKTRTFETNLNIGRGSQLSDEINTGMLIQGLGTNAEMGSGREALLTGLRSKEFRTEGATVVIPSGWKEGITETLGAQTIPVSPSHPSETYQADVEGFNVRNLNLVTQTTSGKIVPSKSILSKGAMKPRVEINPTDVTTQGENIVRGAYVVKPVRELQAMKGFDIKYKTATGFQTRVNDLTAGTEGAIMNADLTGHPQIKGKFALTDKKGVEPSVIDSSKINLVETVASSQFKTRKEGENIIEAKIPSFDIDFGIQRPISINKDKFQTGMERELIVTDKNIKGSSFLKSNQEGRPVDTFGQINLPFGSKKESLQSISSTTTKGSEVDSTINVVGNSKFQRNILHGTDKTMFKTSSGIHAQNDNFKPAKVIKISTPVTDVNFQAKEQTTVLGEKKSFKMPALAVDDLGFSSRSVSATGISAPESVMFSKFGESRETKIPRKTVVRKPATTSRQSQFSMELKGTSGLVDTVNNKGISADTQPVDQRIHHDSLKSSLFSWSGRAPAVGSGNFGEGNLMLDLSERSSTPSRTMTSAVSEKEIKSHDLASQNEFSRDVIRNTDKLASNFGSDSTAYIKNTGTLNTNQFGSYSFQAEKGTNTVQSSSNAHGSNRNFVTGTSESGNLKTITPDFVRRGGSVIVKNDKNILTERTDGRKVTEGMTAGSSLSEQTDSTPMIKMQAMNSNFIRSEQPNVLITKSKTDRSVNLQMAPNTDKTEFQSSVFSWSSNSKQPSVTKSNQDSRVTNQETFRVIGHGGFRTEENAFQQKQLPLTLTQEIGGNFRRSKDRPITAAARLEPTDVTGIKYQEGTYTTSEANILNEAGGVNSSPDTHQIQFRPGENKIIKTDSGFKEADRTLIDKTKTDRMNVKGGETIFQTISRENTALGPIVVNKRINNQASGQFITDEIGQREVASAGTSRFGSAATPVGQKRIVLKAEVPDHEALFPDLVRPTSVAFEGDILNQRTFNLGDTTSKKHFIPASAKERTFVIEGISIHQGPLTRVASSAAQKDQSTTTGNTMVNLKDPFHVGATGQNIDTTNMMSLNQINSNTRQTEKQTPFGSSSNPLLNKDLIAAAERITGGMFANDRTVGGTFGQWSIRSDANFTSPKSFPLEVAPTDQRNSASVHSVKTFALDEASTAKTQFLPTDTSFGQRRLIIEEVSPLQGRLIPTGGNSAAPKSHRTETDRAMINEQIKRQTNAGTTGHKMDISNTKPLNTQSSEQMSFGQQAVGGRIDKQTSLMSSSNPLLNKDLITAAERIATGMLGNNQGGSGAFRQQLGRAVKPSDAWNVEGNYIQDPIVPFDNYLISNGIKTNVVGLNGVNGNKPPSIFPKTTKEFIANNLDANNVRLNGQQKGAFQFSLRKTISQATKNTGSLDTNLLNRMVDQTEEVHVPDKEQRQISTKSVPNKVDCSPGSLICLNHINQVVVRGNNGKGKVGLWRKTADSVSSEPNAQPTV